MEKIHSSLTAIHHRPVLCMAHNYMCRAFTGLEGSWSVYTCTTVDPWVMHFTPMLQLLLMVDFLSLGQACLRKQLKERILLWVQVPGLLVCDHLVLCCFGWWSKAANPAVDTRQGGRGRGQGQYLSETRSPVTYFPNQAPYPKGPLGDKFINGIFHW